MAVSFFQGTLEQFSPYNAMNSSTGATYPPGVGAAYQRYTPVPSVEDGNKATGVMPNYGARMPAPPTPNVDAAPKSFDESRRGMGSS